MPVFPMAAATSVLLEDGWHDLTANTLSLVLDPSFTDPAGTAITPGEPWLQFEDSTGQAFACPVRCLLGVKMSGLLT